MQSPHPTSPKGGEIEWAPARGPLTSMYNPRHEILYLCSVSNRLPHRAKRARSGNHGRAAPPTGPRQRSSPRVQRRRSPAFRDSDALAPSRLYLCRARRRRDRQRRPRQRPCHPHAVRRRCPLRLGGLRPHFPQCFRPALPQRRQSPAHWDPAHPEEDRGLDILNGGTKEIRFVKEGVRVSEFELQPGAVVPLHDHGGPHHVVALTDYELRSDVKGKGSRIITMKRGEIQWAAGGYSHILTNTSDYPARFIALEFR